MSYPATSYGAVMVKLVSDPFLRAVDAPDPGGRVDASKVAGQVFALSDLGYLTQSWLDLVDATGQNYPGSPHRHHAPGYVLVYLYTGARLLRSSDFHPGVPLYEYPFTGTGFAPGKPGLALPEYYQLPITLPAGAHITAIPPDGRGMRRVFDGKRWGRYDPDR